MLLIPGARALLDLVAGPDGRLSESKIWTHVGKALAAWLLVKHGAAIVAQWEVLATLLGLIVGPELYKKTLAMRKPAKETES